MNPLIPFDYFMMLAVPLVLGVALVSWTSSCGIRPVLRAGMTGARALGAAAVLALLLNPGRWREWKQDLTPGWALMLDRSASMKTADAGEGGARTRWEEGLAIVRDALKASGRPDRVRLYTFSQSAEAADPGKLDGRQPDGDSTRLVQAGQEMLALEQGRSGLRGVILVSDGRQPVPAASEAFALRAAARGAPVYPVVLGGEVVAGDLSVRAVRRRYVGFLGQPVTVQAALDNIRMGPVQARVVLKPRDGGPTREQTLFVTNGQSAVAGFEVQPAQAGYHEYTVDVPVREGEAINFNNTVNLEVVVLNNKLNVLILEGEPYWDTKFLSHLLRGQTNMNVTAVFRVTKDRFFKVSSDSGLAAVKDNVFPDSDEEMAAYDLVVIGRGSEYLIDDGRARLLDRFVKDHGGCLFFARGKSYASPSSPLAGLEPVEWGKEISFPFVLRPTVAGDMAGLFGGLLPERDSKVWSGMPPLERGNRCESLKGFSQVLADAVPAGSAGLDPVPGLVSRRHGRGLVLLINGDGLWKWGFFPKAETHDVYRNLWLHLFQWTLSFSEFNPGADYALQLDRNRVRAGEPVRARVAAKSPEIGMPFLRLREGQAFIRDLPLAPEGDGAGRWVGVAAIEKPGLYRVAVETTNGPVSDVQAAIQVLPPPSEGDERSADPAFLQELAALSGGRVLTRADVPALVKELEQPRDSAMRDRVEWDPAWDRSDLAVAMVLCLSLEWFWRRKNGLL